MNADNGEVRAPTVIVDEAAADSLVSTSRYPHKR